MFILISNIGASEPSVNLNIFAFCVRSSPVSFAYYPLICFGITSNINTKDERSADKWTLVREPPLSRVGGGGMT